MDKRDTELIIKVLRFSQEDGFWQKNILSMGKFRAQFDTLLAQCGGNMGTVGGYGVTTQRPNRQSLADVAREM